MKALAPTSTIRPIKGIATLLTVSTPKKNEISDELARGIVEYL